MSASTSKKRKRTPPKVVKVRKEEIADESISSLSSLSEHVVVAPESNDQKLNFSDLPDDAIHNDTHVAMKGLMSSFHLHQDTHGCPAIVLQSQLYAMLSNRSLVDREIDEGVRSGLLSRFQLYKQDTNDVGICITDEYVKACKGCVENVHKSNDTSQKFRRNLDLRYNESLRKTSLSTKPLQKDRRRIVLNAFVEKVAPSLGGVSITQTRLLKRMGFKEDDTDVLTPLIQCGFIVPGVSSRAYWFQVPRAGRWLACVLRGRREVLQIIGRTKYKECMMKKVIQTKLRTSSLGSLFHIRDLLGCDLIERVETPGGALLRIKSNH